MLTVIFVYLWSTNKCLRKVTFLIAANRQIRGSECWLCQTNLDSIQLTTIISSFLENSDDYTLRLAGAGSLYNAGRVEIYYNNQWGTICDSSWDLDDATVVCKRLGFAFATEAPRGAFYGEGSGPVWLDEVGCSGSETSLEECAHTGLESIDCAQFQDASVVCSTQRHESKN